MLCKFLGHKFVVSKKITAHIKEYKCCKCNKETTTNGAGKLIDLTPEYKEINLVLYQVYNKKQAKIRRKELLAAYNKTS